jgi:mono/diheme cytochrome c family protein
VDLDALAAYVASLDKFGVSPYRDADGSLTDAGERGKQVFVQMECGLCHGVADFTDSETGLFHDIGTIKEITGTRLTKPVLGFDIPTLKGLWLSEPYLHDGSAKTLGEALTAGNGTLHHGNVGQLTQQQRDDLVAYLLQLDDDETGTAPFVELKLTHPENGAVFKTGKSVPLRLQTNLQQITEVRYYVDGTEIYSTTNPAEEVSYKFGAPGSYNVQAKVYHKGGKLASVTADTRVAAVDDDCGVAFTMFPNPVSDELRISLEGVSGAHLRVFDIKGALLIDARMENTTGIVDLSTFERGVYLLVVEKSGCRMTKRVVKG